MMHRERNLTGLGAEKIVGHGGWYIGVRDTPNNISLGTRMRFCKSYIRKSSVG